MTTIDTPMTKAEWLKRCAERFAMRAGFDMETAAAMAVACWDCNVEDLGSEAEVLEEVTPYDAADEELSIWAED